MKKETPNAKVIRTKLKDLKKAQPNSAKYPIKRGSHIAFKMKTAPDEEKGIEDANFWNHAIVLEVCYWKIKVITFCKSLMDIDESQRPVQRDFMFESDCIKMGSSGLVKANVNLVLQQAEVSINDMDCMHRYEQENNTEDSENIRVIERAEAMVANPTKEWDYNKFTSEEFAMRAVTGKEDFTRVEVKLSQLVVSAARQDFSHVVLVLLPQYGKMALDIGLPEVIKKIVMKVYSFMATEFNLKGKVAKSFLKLCQNCTETAAPPMAVTCAAITGGIGAAVGIALEAGFFVFKICRAIHYRREKLWTKKQFCKSVLKQVTMLMTSSAGAITASIVGSIVGALVGGPGGIVVGMGTGAVIACTFRLLTHILEKYNITGKLCDRLMGPDSRLEIEYSKLDIQESVKNLDTKPETNIENSSTASESENVEEPETSQECPA